MRTESFFEESREQSTVKTAIVSKYFWSWAKVIIPQVEGRGQKITYLDLFAGPGRFQDGTKSTPLLILETAIQDQKMRKMLVTIFNGYWELPAPPEPVSTGQLRLAASEYAGTGT